VYRNRDKTAMNRAQHLKTHSDSSRLMLGPLAWTGPVTAVKIL
jgi:hypothetical protein